MFFSEELVALFLEYFQAQCFRSKYSEAENFLLTVFVETNEREYDPRGIAKFFMISCRIFNIS